MAIIIGQPEWGPAFSGSNNGVAFSYPDEIMFRNENIGDLFDAHENYFQANDAWHVKVGGYHLPTEAGQATGAVVSEPHPQLREFHDGIKLRTQPHSPTPPFPEFWNAQATILGDTLPGRPASFSDNEALKNELKEAYLRHAGEETRNLVSAAKTAHEVTLELATGQLEALRNYDVEAAQRLHFLEPEQIERFNSLRQSMIARLEEQLPRLQRSVQETSHYINEMPAILTRISHLPVSDVTHATTTIETTPEPLTSHPSTTNHGHGGGGVGEPQLTAHASEHTAAAIERRAVGAAETLERTGQVVAHEAEHSRNRGLMIAGIVAAAGLGIGAFLLGGKNKKAASIPKKTDNPIRVDSVQLGASKAPAQDQPNWVAATQTETSTSPSISK